jgi:hypothetical protein
MPHLMQASMNYTFAKRLLAWNFAATILTSAFLLFQVQPIISKRILPWFGGSPAVWTTCTVFFQCVLVVGYAYAHALQRLPSRKAQMAVHLLLIVLSVGLLPISPDQTWKPIADELPTWRILCLLAVSVGAPFFVLSTTGPLVQTWFSRAFVGRSPYRLYALSNVGSFAALVTYPFIVEPALDLNTQSQWWSIGFCLFIAMSAAAAIAVALLPARDSTNQAVSQLIPSPPFGFRFLWLALPAFASMMLLATTNHICQDVAVIPFLWILPLGLYLLSFIIAFDAEHWYLRRTYAAAALALLVAAAVIDHLATTGSVIGFSFVQELLVYNVGLFAICMVCHGELARLKPHPRHLTSYYLTVSLGGALGGLFVSLVAPILFTTYFEWQLGLIGGGLLAGLVLLISQGSVSPVRQRRMAIAATLLFVAFAGINCVPQSQVTVGGGKVVVTTRSFYGTANVLERFIDNPQQHQFQLVSGRIVHGVQFVKPEKRLLPTAYYGKHAGVGRVLDRLATTPDTKIGAIGLGIGTIATYCTPQQSIRFFEINPEVKRLAERYFSYLQDCRGQHEVVLGDGRLSLEREAPQNFDLLVIDAFSGDAIPTHLLTREAMDIYRKHLSQNGELAFNISNRYLDLVPVVEQLAQYAGFTALHIASPGDEANGVFAANWMILSRSADTLAALRPFASGQVSDKSQVALWTDDHSNLFEILK